MTYTLTFSEDMAGGTVDASDFGNAGSSNISIGTISEPSPGVVSVQVTPLNGGTLQLEIVAGAYLKDAAGNPLDTTTAIADDTTINVNDLTPPVITLTNPADDAPNIGLTTSLVAAFDEDIIAGIGDIVIYNVTDGATHTTIAVTDVSCPASGRGAYRQPPSGLCDLKMISTTRSSAT